MWPFWLVLAYLTAMSADGINQERLMEGCHFRREVRVVWGGLCPACFTKRSKDVLCWQRSTLTEPAHLKESK